MMVRLLVLDMLRRVAYWPIAPLAIGFALTWFFLPARGGAAPVIAMSLAATHIIGPVAMLGWLGTPVVPYLPVSRREVWCAAWIMGTLAPVALMAALKLPGTPAGGAGWSTLTLSSFMDLLYAGAGCALVAKASPVHIKRAGGGVIIWMLLLFFGGILMPFAIQRWLPTEWAEVGPVHAVMFAVGAALTTWSALHSPKGVWPRGVRSESTSSGPVTVAPTASRLSGLPRLLAHELVWSTGMAITLFVVFLLLALFAESLSGSFTTVQQFVASQRLFIFNPAAVSGADRDFDVFSQLGWYAFFVAAVSARFPQALRHLRVLPLGNASLHALLLGWPLAVWIGVWVLLAFVHAGFSQPITSLRLPLLLAIVAVSQFAQALQLRVWKPWISVALLSLPFARIGAVLDDWMLMAVWAIATVAAVALNINALSRNATYKRVPQPQLKTGSI